MTFKAQEALDWVKDDLGYVPETVTSGMALLNDAGDHLASMHRWRWYVRRADLDTVASQEYVSLPADFVALLRTVRPGQYEEVFPVGDEKLLRVQLDQVAYEPYLATVRYVTVSGEVIPRMFLDPVPSASTVGEIRISYRAGWTELGAPDDDIILPYWLRSLYHQLVVAFGRGRLENDGELGPGVAALEGQLAVVERGSIFRAARMRDATFAPKIGPMQGGMVETHNHMRDFSSFPSRLTISPPSVS